MRWKRAQNEEPAGPPVPEFSESFSSPHFYGTSRQGQVQNSNPAAYRNLMTNLSFLSAMTPMDYIVTRNMTHFNCFFY